MRSKRRGCCSFRCGCLVLVLVLAISVGGILLFWNYFTTGGPQPFDESFEPSETDAANFERVYDTAVTQSASTNFELRFTEDEFASWLNLRQKDEIARQARIEEYTDNMEFQAQFRDGEVRVFMSFVLIKELNVYLNTLAVLEITPTPNPGADQSKLEIVVKDFQIGRTKATEGLEKDIITAINDSLTELLEPIEAQGVSYEITDIVAESGVLTITGHMIR